MMRQLKVMREGIRNNCFFFTSPKLEIFEKLIYYCNRLINTLPTSSQPLPGNYLKPKYTQKRVFDPLCPNMVKYGKI
jgi:hypothetical protein